MSQARPKLSHLKQTCPQDLARCEGYLWHLGTKIGKGSFGDVYLGWSSDGRTEVAVKVVKKEFFKQDPKVRENLEREIRILKLLRGCEYVVQLFHVQELRQYIVLVMELCDYDLDHLVKIDPFKEENVIVFLFQLAQGMEALRAQNIVHRDLKPGNILMKRHLKTGKMMIKLADFGFARHFKDEGNKVVDMTSLAGTPVFMAPEALSCVFHPGEHYDDKVDIWSIGALLYKVIVGQCGFYAQLQDIPRILKHKGDAIAFERGQNRKINYIYELPSSVNDRLTEGFRVKMKSLLCSMLKLDPRERMTFTEFFESVDDIIRSKVEIINVLYGTSFKIISDPSLTSDVLIDKVHIQWRIPSTGQVIFSKSCRHYIAPNESISHDQFVELLEKSGGSHGHAKLYLLPVQQLQLTINVVPDTSLFAHLKHHIEDPVTIVTMVKEEKFADEIVHMIGSMGARLRKQLEGQEELSLFTDREISTFRSSVYPSILEQAHQALAKVVLAAQWLADDINLLNSGPDPTTLHTILALLQEHKLKLKEMLVEMAGFNSSFTPRLTSSFSIEGITKLVTSLTDRAKKLARVPHTSVQSLCKEVTSECEGEMKKVTTEALTQLMPFNDMLLRLWSLRTKTSSLFEVCSSVNLHIEQAILERNRILKAITSGTVQDAKAHNVPAANHMPVPLPVMTPPPGMWSNASIVGGTYLPPAGQSWPDPVALDKLKQEIDQLKLNFASSTDENRLLKAEVATLKSSTGDVEATLIASEIKPAASSSASNQSEVLECLTEQLKMFCSVAEGISGSAANKVAQSKSDGGSALYPNLLMDYSVIPLPGEDQDLAKLIPMAQQLATTVSKCKLPLGPTMARDGANNELVKIGRPTEYRKGDVVIFMPVKTLKSKSTIPSLLHLQLNKPFMLMENSCYSHFNIRPGKVPDFLLAKLSEDPQKLMFEDQREIALDIGQGTGEFYRVKAETVSLKFSASRSGSLSQASGVQVGKPSRPTTGSPGRKGYFHLSSHGKSGKDYV